jgi:vacuolar protein sorting-associated protein IST1
MKWDPAVAKVTQFSIIPSIYVDLGLQSELRLATQRLGQMQARYDSQATITRADISTLIQQGNIPLARDKVEKLIQDETFGDLLAELEMQVGLLLEHFRELEHGYVFFS